MTSDMIGTADGFRAAVADHLGLQFEDDKLPFLAEVFHRRLTATGLSEADYLDALAGDDALEEQGALARELTVPETYFFRHMAQFDALREVALPARTHLPSVTRQLRILSAGCASGEEAYSIAMLVRDMGLAPGWTISIRAVDLNPAALKKAQSGRFSAWALRETPEAVRDRWFVREGRDFRIADEIRRAVTFEQRNLVEPDDMLWRPDSYDIIFCRNAIMYLTGEKMLQVIGHIEQALVPGGHLFLGHAETLRGLSDAFTLCQSHGTFYYCRTPELQPVGKAPVRWTETQDDAANSPAPIDWMAAIDKAARQIGKLAETAPEQAEGDAATAAARAIQSVLSLAADERFREALEAVDACLADDSGNAQLQLLRAMLLIHCGQAADAECAAQALLERGGAQAGAHHVLALCREKAGDLDTACKHDRAAAHADASFAMPHLHLGLLAKRAGRSAEMKRELARAQILLRREDATRLSLFGGGFTRQALIDLCAATLDDGGQRR